MPEYMKAVGIKNGAGHADALFINPETPIPTPKPEQALIRIKAFGLNRMDLIQREGNYPLPPQAPSTLGVEFSGTIAAFGSALHSRGFSVGDAVFGLAYGGAYAEYIAVSTKMLLHKPAELSWEAAAGIPETFITATQAMHFVGEFGTGKSVLWHAGASGVSIAGIQLSKRAGAGAVYATAGSDEKCAFIERELGATRAFNYKTQDWSQEILKLTDGKGVDLIIDFIAGDYVQKNFECAARDARIVSLGAMGGPVLKEVNMVQLLYKRIRWEGSTLRSRDEEYQGRLRDKLATYMSDFVSGELKVFVHDVFPMEDIIKAHQLMEKNVTLGKIICTVP